MNENKEESRNRHLWLLAESAKAFKPYKFISYGVMLLKMSPKQINDEYYLKLQTGFKRGI